MVTCLWKDSVAALPSLSAALCLASSIALVPSSSRAQASQASTQQLAVLEFKNLTGDHSDEAKSVLLFLSDQVRNRTKDALPWVAVITRENVVALLAAQGKSLEECEREGECEVQTGQRLGADYLISGELLRIDKELRLSLKLHDTRASALLKGLSVQMPSGQGMEEALRKAVPQLLIPLLEKAAEQKARAQRLILYTGIGAAVLGAAAGAAQFGAHEFANQHAAAMTRYAAATDQAALDAARADASSANRSGRVAQTVAIGLAGAACTLVVLVVWQLWNAP